MSRSAPRVAIIGTGFSGLALAIRLRQEGFREFTLIEKADRIGGTWRENTYPGAACDLMSFAYCFSFEQKTDWSRKWSPQAEILAYIDHCAEKYGILPHVRFGTEVTGARFDEEHGCWRIRTTTDGRENPEIEAEVLVSGVGQLHRPVVPKIPGLERFEGEVFHSAQWRHDLDLAGKRIGVVGNGASAIQFVPEIAPEAEQLTVFQRTPNWMIPRGDRPYTRLERGLLSHVPGLARAYRWFIWARQELMFFVLTGNAAMVRKWKQIAHQQLEEQVPDPTLRALLTPDYAVGGKRILIHDDYYPALVRENVTLVSEGIDRIEAGGVLTSDGQRHAFDVLIMATGFDTNAFLAPMAIEGVDGRVLEKEWADGAEAYLGLTVAGFPNFFMMYGPNTNLGHNSIIFMIECQANYIVRCLARIEERRLRYLDLAPAAMRAFNRKMHADLAETAWAKIPHSWYKTDAGKITNNWSGTTTRYWWETRRPKFDDYRQVQR